MMRALAVAVVFCAVLGAQAADDLDHLFEAHQWFELRSAVTGRSPALMRPAVATAFNDPETAERLLRDVIRSAPASNAADEAYGMLSQIYLRSGQYGRWLTSYRQWVAAIPDSARARAQVEDEKKFAGRPDQVNGRRRRAVLRHDSGEFTLPVSVDGKADDYLFDTGAWQSVMTARRASRLGLKIDPTPRVLILKPGNGIDRDLTKIGAVFRAAFGSLTFDRFIVDVVTPGLEDAPYKRVEPTAARFSNTVRWVDGRRR